MFKFPALMKFNYEDYGNYYRNWWIMHFHTIIDLKDGITPENLESRMDDFINHLRELEVKRINTLVEKSDSQLLDYFNANQFSPSKNVINLERNI